MRRPAWVVYRKELRDTLRDWRTIFVMVVLPFLLYPLISVVSSEWATRHVARQKARPSHVTIAGHVDDGKLLVDELSGGNFVITRQPGPVPDVKDRKALGEADAVIEIPVGFEQSLRNGAAIELPVYYDETDDESETARNRIAEVVDRLAQRELARRLAERGIPPALIEPLEVADRNVATVAKMGRAEVGKMLPIVIVMMIFMGAFYPAIDQTAGEKERGTLESLLTTPVPRRSLVLGKYFAVATIAFVTGLLNIISIFVSLFWLVRQAVRASGGAVSFDAVLSAVPWDAVALGVFALAVVSLLAAGLMIVVAALARNFKEAQTFLAPVQVATTVPAMAAALPGTSLDYGTALIPISNVTLLLKDGITGTLQAGPAIVTLVMTALLGAVALGLATRLFDSERILFAAEGPRGPRSLRELIKLIRRPRDATLSTAVVTDLPDEDSPLTAGEGLGLFVLTGALWFFLGPELQGRGVSGFIASQVVILLGPTLLFARLKGVDVRAVIGWRRPAPGTMAGAFLIGASAWAVSWGVGLVQEAISPVPPELAEAMRRQLEGMGKSPVLLLVAVSLVPAVCEEILCRGMLARALRGTLGIVAAAAVAAVLFALLHQSMYRFFPQLVLGLSLGLVTLSARSVIPAIVIHLMHNGILLALGYLGLTIDPPLAIPAALIVYAAGHVLALRRTSP